MKCRRRFVSPSPNPPRTQPAGASNTQHTSTCSFRCSRSTMTKIPMMRCRAQMAAGPANSADRLLETHINLAFRLRARSMEDSSCRRNSVPRSEQSRARYLYHARFFSRSVGDAARSRQDRSSDSANICANTKPRSRRRQQPCEHHADLVGSQASADTSPERLARSRWKQRHHVIESDGRCRSCRKSNRSWFQLLPVLQLEIRFDERNDWQVGILAITFTNWAQGGLELPWRPILFPFLQGSFVDPQLARKNRS